MGGALTRLAAGLCLLLPAAASGGDDPDWKLERIGADAAGAPPASPLPKEIPEPFAQLLRRDGLRLLAAAPAKGEKRERTTLCELWLRAELPLAEKPATALGVKQTKLAPGSFVAVLRTFGATRDYRDQPIAAGVYALRYFHQPADGDHQGTSDSRDFLILTGFEKDREPAPVADQEALVALAKAVSPSDHPLVVYVAAPPPEPDAGAPAADAAPRFFKRGESDEWAAELQFAGKAPGAAAAEPLRLGLVLVGHTAH